MTQFFSMAAWCRLRINYYIHGRNWDYQELSVYREEPSILCDGKRLSRRYTHIVCHGTRLPQRWLINMRAVASRGPMSSGSIKLAGRGMEVLFAYTYRSTSVR